MRRRGWRIPLHRASAEALPFRDAVFDPVLNIGRINPFDDRAAALAEMVRVAKAGTRVVFVDKNERGARACERSLPGFRSSFGGRRPQVTVPVAELPAGMERVAVSDVPHGWFYCLELVTPAAPGDPDGRQ
jgi:ubiquinone/menaquinone biosynthesis C-methylase UbiE